MKAAVIQLPYSTDYGDSEKIFRKEFELLDSCDDSMDLIVLPESCDVPALPSDYGQLKLSHRLYTQKMLEKASETAKRCNAVVFVNGFYENGAGGRNTTFAISRRGEIVGRYHKEHLTPGETFKYLLDSEYTYEFSSPTVVEIDGIRYGFLTCYDFYFYENFANIAINNVDIIIGCSHQRSDPRDMSEIICRFCALNTDSYLLRASVSFGEGSETGGASMIVSPEGRILAELRNEIGIATAVFDPKAKYLKPAGFGNPPAAHYEYIEKGRRPWKYRPAGSAVCRHDEIMPYPRVCAHRGFSAVAPENSMPAFGAAVALGADEIEFDLWTTKDGEIVSAHDRRLDRVSDGTGDVSDCTYAQLLKLDFGKKFAPQYAGLKIPTFEQILKKFACHAIMNIHLKSADNTVALDEKALLKIIGLIRKYDCSKYVYFMTGNNTVMKQLIALAPDISRCQGAGDNPDDIVEFAIENKCRKLQFFKPHISCDMIKKAHEHNIRCNVFWSDDPQEAAEFIKMGVDTVLTNDYHRIAQAIKTDVRRTP